MSKILLVGDVHLADRPPSTCTESYTDDLFDLLYQTVDLTKDPGYTAVVQAGDLFHSKVPARTSHKLIQRTIEWVQSYPCPVYIVPGNHDMCVPDDTEALTDRGWLTRDQLVGGECFATLNPVTGAFEWQQPTSLVVGPYSGDLLKFKTQSMEQVVTPNHSLWLTTRSRKTGFSLFRKERASLIAARKSQDVVRFKLSADSWTGLSEDVVKIPPSRSLRGFGFELSSVLAAEFFGWYLSEGSSEPWRVTISQCPIRHPEYFARIEELVRLMGFEPSLSSPKTIRLGSAALSEFVSSQFGRVSHEKRIPSWVKDWPVELLEILLRSMLDGDGTKNANGWAYRSNSERLIDDVQEIAIKLGWAAHRGLSFRSVYDNGGVVYGGVRDIFPINLCRRTQAGNSEVTSVFYEGLVWCPSLPNGVWLQRRNGKACWTGNSNDQLDSVSLTQPLGVILRSGAKLLHGWAGDLPLYGIPWLQEWNERDPEGRGPSLRALAKVEEELRVWHEFYDGSYPALLVTHAPFYIPSMELPYEYFPTSQFAAQMGRRGSVYYGHIHEAHGQYVVNGVRFCNHGALSRGSLNEYNLTREIAVTAWDTVTGEFTKVPLKYRPAGEVFKLQEARELKSLQVSLDEFLASIGQASIEVTSLESVIAYVQSLGLGAEVESAIEELLQGAAHV